MGRALRHRPCAAGVSEALADLRLGRREDLGEGLAWLCGATPTRRTERIVLGRGGRTPSASRRGRSASRWSAAIRATMQPHDATTPRRASSTSAGSTTRASGSACTTAAVRILKFRATCGTTGRSLTERRIDWSGRDRHARHGGSALYFADLLQLNGAAGPRDQHRRRRRAQTRCGQPSAHRFPARRQRRAGDGGAAAADACPPRRAAPLFMISTPDHGKAHVLRELRAAGRRSCAAATT